MLILLFSYLFILITKSITLEFETSSNTSQFIDLENLIGSFHLYTPASSLLFVRNTGLTDGQLKLLERYQNIQIISSTYNQLNNIRKINVDHEFLLINNTLINRYNQQKYLFINFIRKKFFLAIVIPFIPSQIKQINLNRFYPSCHNHSNSIDLIFYSNQKNIIQFNYSNECFENIHYLSADLSKEEDQYPIGSAIMWKKLFLSSISLRTRGYTHFFLMEPDTRPIRSYWLDAIVQLITNGHNQNSYLVTQWWMIGSIYRGFELIGKDYFHINGNALYHLTYDFIKFIENVSNEYPYNSKKSMGYDLDIFSYLFEHPNIVKNVWHKFQFTDVIQNCWHTGCHDKNIEFIFNNPNTYLIHGQKISQNKHTKLLLDQFFYIILLGFVIVLVFSRFRHSCRRLFCKRKIIFR